MRKYLFGIVERTLMGIRPAYVVTAALALLVESVSSPVSVARQLGYGSEASEVESKLPAWMQSPNWAKDLVIYNVATREFTSPSGPESGTFESLSAKMPYLQELGITAIWLTGHSLADPHHFFNIWTQYACIEPDRIDPTLGTPEQFKSMIDRAHRYGIKIFLDVVTHGVMASSPLVNRHPEWFRGGSFGMVDYDWTGGHVDLDDWWVKIWTNAVIEYGVDGFRLDMGIPVGNQGRYDLWARVRRNAESAGHPIAIMEEGSSVVRGIGTLDQGIPRMTNPFRPNDYHALFLNNVPLYYDYHFGRAGDYKVKIEYEDGNVAEGSSAKAGELQIRLDGRTLDRASARPADPVSVLNAVEVDQHDVSGVQRADGIPDVELTVEGVASKAIRNITVILDDGSVHPRKGLRWSLHEIDTDIGRVSPIAMRGDAPSITLFVPTVSYNSSFQLSAIDAGWWNSDESPYVAQGSRATFGYSLLFTPRIPIFMAGEEFDATFRPVPGLTTDTVEHTGLIDTVDPKDRGKGKILLGSMLDWNELNEPAHRAMFEDVRRMLAIRRQQNDLLTPQVRGDIEPKLLAVPYRSNIDVPVPYIRWNANSAVIILANRNTQTDAVLKLKIPVSKLARAASKYRVTDLWNGQNGRIYSVEQLMNFTVTVRRDKVPRGGVGVLKIEAIH